MFNKKEIDYYRKNVIKSYVTEVMAKYDRYETKPVLRKVIQDGKIKYVKLKGDNYVHRHHS